MLIRVSVMDSRDLSIKTGPIALIKSLNASIAVEEARLDSSSVIMKSNLGIISVLK